MLQHSMDVKMWDPGKDSGMKTLLGMDTICDKAKHSLGLLSICCLLCCTGPFPLHPFQRADSAEIQTLL